MKVTDTHHDGYKTTMFGESYRVYEFFGMDGEEVRKARTYWYQHSWDGDMGIDYSISSDSIQLSLNTGAELHLMRHTDGKLCLSTSDGVIEVLKAELLYYRSILILDTPEYSLMIEGLKDSAMEYLETVQDVQVNYKQEW